jgi:hypothetical protein
MSATAMGGWMMLITTDCCYGWRMVVMSGYGSEAWRSWLWDGADLHERNCYVWVGG